MSRWNWPIGVRVPLPRVTSPSSATVVTVPESESTEIWSRRGSLVILNRVPADAKRFVAGLVADGAAEDEGLALAAQDLAEVVTGQAGGRGIDQGRRNRRGQRGVSAHAADEGDVVAAVGIRNQKVLAHCPAA